MNAEQLTAFVRSAMDVAASTKASLAFDTARMNEAASYLKNGQRAQAVEIMRRGCKRLEEMEARWKGLRPPDDLKTAHEAALRAVENLVLAKQKQVAGVAANRPNSTKVAGNDLLVAYKRDLPILDAFMSQVVALARRNATGTDAKLLTARSATGQAGRSARTTPLLDHLEAGTDARLPFARSSTGQEQFSITPPQDLPTFRDVGGMESLKEELQNTLGLLLKFPDVAKQFNIDWNGLLLYGRPGSGKTFIARAVAGEFGLNFLAVGTVEIASKWRGESAKLIERAFAVAERHIPCALFFDEFDSVAAARDGNPSQEDRGMVNQLLRSLETYRHLPGLVVMAATNDIDHLDEAVVRSGRFDRHIRVEYPDQEGRKAILMLRLTKLPAGEVDFELVARRCRGFSAATIVEVVQSCALDAFRRQTSGEKDVQITTQSLLTAIDRRGGQDRPSLDEWNWGDVIVDKDTKAELQEIQAFIERPELAESFGVAPPTGVLLYGPPGTGKTTIAKVLAAETRASFYPISCSDIVSKWVGESERNVAKLFERARENRPSIIFIDEIDALFPKRSEMMGNGTQDRLVNQFLEEIDGIAGQEGVFIIGATNRRDILDTAVLRGGRLSRQIEVPLPDEGERVLLLSLYTGKMPLEDVDLASLAKESPELSGADLKAMCQAAAMRASRNDGGRRTVTQSDFRDALLQVKLQMQPHT